MGCDFRLKRSKIVALLNRSWSGKANRSVRIRTLGSSHVEMRDMNSQESLVGRFLAENFYIN